MLKSGVFCLVVSCLALLCTVACAEPPSEELNQADVDLLVQTFCAKGFDQTFLRQSFSDSRLRFIPNPVKLNVVNREYAANYKRFLDPVALGMARRFSRKWRTALKNAGRTFSVDKEIVVAILLVETSLGKYLGNDSVMSVYTSLFLSNYGRRRQTFEKAFADDPDRERYIKRLATKAHWAGEELAALLTMQRDRKINIHALKGSYAGAFGIPQFLPSSYLKWGYDGDNSNTVDLFYVPDAIVSVVNYLKAHGWQPGLEHESNKKVLWCYNRSNAYINTVLAIARKLKKATSTQMVQLPLEGPAPPAEG